MKSIYLSHPFTGNEKNNRKKARKIATNICKAAKKRKSSIAILNPCDCIHYAEEAGLSYEECVEICLKLIDGCDALVLAKGWENSKGCIIEAAYAVYNAKAIGFLPDKTDDKWNGVITLIQKNKHFTNILLEKIEKLKIKSLNLKNKTFLNI